MMKILPVFVSFSLILTLATTVVQAKEVDTSTYDDTLYQDNTTDDNEDTTLVVDQKKRDIKILWENKCKDREYLKSFPALCKKYKIVSPPPKKKKKPIKKLVKKKTTNKLKKTVSISKSNSISYNGTAKKEAKLRAYQGIKDSLASTEVNVTESEDGQYFTFDINGWDQVVNSNAYNLYKEVPAHYDQDYRRLGSATLHHSYPVNLSRVLVSGSFIRVTIKNLIYSESGEGTVQGIVSNNVFATHGSKILIPASSLLEGSYQSIQQVGITRIDIKWSIILYPNGTKINLNQSQSHNISGVTNVGGFYDPKHYEKYGKPLLYSVLNQSASGALLDGIDPTNQAALTQIVASTQEIVQSILQENLNIKPILKIPAGKIILVKTSNDLFFHKSQYIKTTVTQINEIKVNEIKDEN